MKKVLALMLTMAIAISFAACTNNNVAPQVAEDGRTYGGYTEFKVGKKVSTQFFDFTVTKVQKVTSYQDLTPAEGNVFVLATITSTNTGSFDTPIYYYDFQIQWGEDDNSYGYSVLDEESENGLAPFEKVLKENESMTELYLFEVPADSKKCSISYLEIYGDDFEGNVFFVYFNI